MENNKIEHVEVQKNNTKSIKISKIAIIVFPISIITWLLLFLLLLSLDLQDFLALSIFGILIFLPIIVINILFILALNNENNPANKVYLILAAISLVLPILWVLSFFIHLTYFIDKRKIKKDSIHSKKSTSKKLTIALLIFQPFLFVLHILSIVFEFDLPILIALLVISIAYLCLTIMQIVSCSNEKYEFRTEGVLAGVFLLFPITNLVGIVMGIKYIQKINANEKNL